MSLKRRIQQAYDPIHAPEDAIERLKRELYQSDIHEGEDAEFELYDVEEASGRPGILKYLVYIAAVLALCVGVGMFWNSMQANRNELHPLSAVSPDGSPVPSDGIPTPPDLESETVNPGQPFIEEWTEGTIPNIVNYHYEYAKKIIEQAGYAVELRYEQNDEVQASSVIRTEPAAGDFAPEGTKVIVYVSQGTLAEGE